jgi:hypothetical protein
MLNEIQSDSKSSSPLGQKDPLEGLGSGLALGDEMLRQLQTCLVILAGDRQMTDTPYAAPAVTLRYRL